MPRPQFSIRTLLWLTLVVAAFFGGFYGGRESMRTKVKDADFRSKLAEMEAKATRDDYRDVRLKMAKAVDDFKKRHGIPPEADISDINLPRVGDGASP